MSKYIMSSMTNINEDNHASSDLADDCNWQFIPKIVSILRG
ncbi:hypothetical protein GJ496_009488, partial [Pomphorhynchus laevis]